MEPANTIETNGDLRRDPATAGQQDPATTGQQLNRSLLSSSSESSSEDGIHLDVNETANTRPLGSNDSPAFHEENGSKGLESKSNQTLRNTGQENVSIDSSDSRAIHAATEPNISILDKELDNSLPSPSYPKIIARATEDPSTLTESHDEIIRISNYPVHLRENSLSSVSSSSSTEDYLQHGANETADVPIGSANAPTLEGEKGSTALKFESNQTFPNIGDGNVSIASSDSRAIPATTSNDTSLSIVDKKLDNSVLAPSSHESECPPKVASQIAIRETEDSPIAPESHKENVQVSSKAMQDHSRTCSSSSSSSSSEDTFQLGENKAADTPLASIDSPILDKDNSPTTLKSESNQTFPNVEHENMRSAMNNSSTIPTITSNEKTNLSIPDKNSDNSLSSPLSEGRNKGIQVSSKPVHGQHGHELTGSPLIPAVQGHSRSNSATQFPPTQVMERPNDPTSSGYRIPSYVFARTKSTAPMEWSTASNESLFSIHMGNMSFNRDQLFWLGKSGELGLSGPLMDLPPTNIKTSNNVHNSTNLDEDFRAAEEKAAEIMREVIRESAENKAKEDALPAKDTSPPSRISRQPDEKTKSFAFSVLSGDGDKSTSVKVEAAKQAQPLRSGTTKATPVAADTPPRSSRMACVGKWFSYYCCSTCCRPSCF